MVTRFVVLALIAGVLSCKPFSHDEPVDAPVFHGGESNFIAVVRLQEPQPCPPNTGCNRGDMRILFSVDEPLAGTAEGNTFVDYDVLGEAAAEYGLEFPLRALVAPWAGRISQDAGTVCGVLAGGSVFQFEQGSAFLQEPDGQNGVAVWCLKGQYRNGYRGDDLRRKIANQSYCRTPWSRLMQEARDIIPLAVLGAGTTISHCVVFPDAAVNPCAGLDGGTCP
jgi:hypothetical protein